MLGSLLTQGDGTLLVGRPLQHPITFKTYQVELISISSYWLCPKLFNALSIVYSIIIYMGPVWVIAKTSRVGVARQPVFFDIPRELTRNSGKLSHRPTICMYGYSWLCHRQN